MKKCIIKILILIALMFSESFCFMYCNAYQDASSNPGNSTNTYKPKVIVSLTSYPKRFCVLPYALKSICRQTVQPDMILLNLCEEENPDKTLIDNVLKENKLNDKVTVNWYKEPIRSYGKLIPALQKYPGDIIITVDDDKEYNENLIKEMLIEHSNKPKCIICGVCEALMDNCQVNFEKYDNLIQKKKPYMGAFIIGSYGVLYPPHCFKDTVFNSALYRKIFPTDDDIWFSYCARISQTPIIKIRNRSEAGTIVKERDTNFNIPRLWDSNSQGITNQNLRKMKKMFEENKVDVQYYISEGTYTIVTSLNNGKALDIPGASKNNKVRLQLYDRNNTKAQKFEIRYNEKGYYNLKACCSDKMLDTAYASKDIGTLIWQHVSNNNSNAQKWDIIPTENGYHSMRSQCNSLYMDVKYAQTDNGTVIHCWENNNSNAQKFKFIRLND